MCNCSTSEHRDCARQLLRGTQVRILQEGVFRGLVGVVREAWIDPRDIIKIDVEGKSATFPEGRRVKGVRLERCQIL